MVPTDIALWLLFVNYNATTRARLRLSAASQPRLAPTDKAQDHASWISRAEQALALHLYK